jgi:hypothetical protein
MICCTNVFFKSAYKQRMKKKKSKKVKEAAASAGKQKTEVAAVLPADKAGTYGGLPPRDLKKNLGCG